MPTLLSTAAFTALSLLLLSPVHAATTPAPHLLQLDQSIKPTPGLKQFLLSTKGTYGWAPVKGGLSYDFFPDGRLHIQGADGEASMWEGKWQLKGDQLTLINSTAKTKKTVTAKIDGPQLLLDGKPYRRYRP